MRIAIAALWLFADLAWSASVSGRVELTTQGRALRAEEAREAVVYFRPATPVAPQPLEAPQQMAMARKQFQPRALPVTVGSEVVFPNFDPILHNVFSPSGANRFDLGLYGEGPGGAHRFEQVGLVRVYCNVHQDMVGHILVLDTPYFSQPDAQGNFRIEVGDDPVGELFVWHERATLWRQSLDGSIDDTPLVARLELNRPRVPNHANKFGRPYGRQGRQRY